MQFNLNNILKKDGELIVEDFRNVMNSKGLNNTGGTSNSLKSKNNEKSLSILGDHHIQQLHFGRKPGKFAPAKAIQDWVRTKLGISDLKKVKTIAFLINRAMAKGKETPPAHSGGTFIFRNRGKGIELEKREEFGTNLIKESVTNLILATVSSDITDQIKLNRTIK